MRLYSYVVRHDNGSAPNPFHQYCTLAICKPVIRRIAEKGDWVVGTGGIGNVGNDKLVYAMEVTDTKTFEEYYNSKEFKDKIPNNVNDTGDNIYEPQGNGEFKQLPSVHSNKDGTENREMKKHDLSGKKVLISNRFYYYGKLGKEIPNKFKEIIKKGPAHKSNFKEDFIEDFIDWIQSNNKTGIISKPYSYIDSKCG